MAFVALIAALLFASPVLPSRAAPSAPCPESQRVRLDPTAFRRSVKKAATDRPALDALLKKLDLALPADCRGHAPKLEGLDLFRAPLTSEAAGDLLVQARVRSCGDDTDDGIALLVQVLRPLGEGGFCKLGTELGADAPASAEEATDARSNCGSPEDPGGWGRTFSFLELIAPGRKVIVVEDRPRTCEDGLGNFAAHVAYWAAEGNALRLVFETDTDHTYWAPHANVCNDSAEIDLLGEQWPRVIRLRLTDSCSRGGPGCARDERRELWEYDLGIYRKTREASQPTWPF